MYAKVCTSFSDDNIEVALVYYRSLYAPNGMTEEFWNLRLLIERSKAIKCPSIPYQLAGSYPVSIVIC